MVGAPVGVAVAQDGGQPSNSTTPEAQDPESNESATNGSDGSGGGGDDSTSAPSREELWQMYQEQASEDQGTTERNIVAQIGPSLTVTKKNFNPGEETLTLWIKADRTTLVTLTDSSALDADKTVSRAQSRSIRVPRTAEGEVIRITVSATEDEDGLQMVTLDPANDNYIYQISNRETGITWFEGEPIWNWFGWFSGFMTLGVVVGLLRKIRKQDRGSITTSSGAKLTSDFSHGVEHIEEGENDD